MYLHLLIYPGYIYQSFVRSEQVRSLVLVLLLRVALLYPESERLIVVVLSEPGHCGPSSKELPLDSVPWQC